MPERIQLRRTKGWRKPAEAVVVARPSRWGNPFVVGEDATITGYGSDGSIYQLSIPITAEMAVAAYRELLGSRLLALADDEEDAVYVDRWRADLRKLRGLDLCCWCPLDQPCHADVLLEMANR